MKLQKRLRQQPVLTQPPPSCCVKTAENKWMEVSVIVLCLTLARSANATWGVSNWISGLCSQSVSFERSRLSRKQKPPKDSTPNAAPPPHLPVASFPSRTREHTHTHTHTHTHMHACPPSPHTHTNKVLKEQNSWSIEVFSAIKAAAFKFLWICRLTSTCWCSSFNFCMHAMFNFQWMFTHLQHCSDHL